MKISIGAISVHPLPLHEDSIYQEIMGLDI